MYTSVTTTSLLTPNERNINKSNGRENRLSKMVSRKDTELSILKTERNKLQSEMNKLIINARKECVADFDLSHEDNKECSLIFKEINEKALGISNYDTIIQEIDSDWIQKRY